MKGEAANQRLKRRGFVFYSEEYMPKSEVKHCQDQLPHVSLLLVQSALKSASLYMSHFFKRYIDQNWKAQFQACCLCGLCFPY